MGWGALGPLIQTVWFSGGEWFSKIMGDDHFKLFGKGLVKDISDSYANVLVKNTFNGYTALIDGTVETFMTTSPLVLARVLHTPVECYTALNDGTLLSGIETLWTGTMLL